ncbi:MAG: SusC/RagA family TonB-linked outer membrane protein [Mangrovibacterium sp.]
MKIQYSRGLILALAAILCFDALLKAQVILIKDTVPSVQEKAVVVAYSSQPSWQVTGAISSASGTDLQGPFTSDFTSRLYGRVSGLSVVAGGAEPGYEYTSLYGRGRNTFGVGGTGMLVLIDGMEADLANLVPEEIESVSFLKDASATAMYGSRGANGVLVVTTKRGTEGKLKVVFSTQQGFQSATRLPRFLGSYDYARLYNEALANDGKDELYTSADLAAYKDGSDPYFHPDVDWYKEVLRDAAPISNYNLNFTGGNKTVRYFVMLNHVKNNSLYRKTGDESEFSINGNYQRLNFRSNVDIIFNKRLSAMVTVGGTVIDKANPAASTTDDIFNQMAQLPPNAFPIYNPNGTLSRNSVFSNPVGDILNKGFYTSNGRTLSTTVGFTEQLDMITKGLSISSRISFNSYFLSQSNKTRTYESFAISQNETGNINYTKYGLNTPLTGSEGTSDQYRNMVYQANLNYDRTFGKHMVNGIVLYNADDYTISGDNFPYKHVNVSGRASYAYDQKYIGELSFSWMGSENFAKGKRFGWFPAVSLGWIVSNEDFLKDNKTINFLKLRSSYGMVGNDKIGGDRFMFDQYYTTGGTYYFGAGNSTYSGIMQGSLANSGVTWEKEKTLNFGVEAKLLKCLDITIDVFNRDRYDILVQPNSTDPDFMGYIKPYQNQGKANNKGFEAKVRYSNEGAGEFRFFAEASVWYYKNKIVDNSESLQLCDYLYATGRPIGQPFGLVALGFFKDAADISSSPAQNWTSVKPGDVKYKDQNGDYKIDELDVYPIGKTDLPNYSAGLRLGAKCKGFDLELFFQGVTGRTVYFSGLNFEAFQDNGKVSEIALGRWTQSTAETATYPRLSSANDDNNYRYSTLWQRDGSFIKLRSAELGYTIPGQIIDRIKLQEARIFVNGTNLFSLDHMHGYRDPEFSGLMYPTVRTISVGLRVQFN